MAKTVQLTKEGKAALEAELEDLILVKRKENTEKIKVAKEQGDLSENAEYDEARDEQRDIEARIQEIQTILQNVEIVGDEKVAKNRISVGSTVTILDVEFDEEDTFKIVGSVEADSMNGKISNESPVGKALIGKKKGDTVDVELESGEVIQYKVIDFKKN